MNFYVIRQPSEPYQTGSEREAAWHIAQAYHGCTLDDVVAAWALMETARKKGGSPKGWVRFFCGPHTKRSGAIREVLAEFH